MYSHALGRLRQVARSWKRQRRIGKNVQINVQTTKLLCTLCTSLHTQSVLACDLLCLSSPSIRSTGSWRWLGRTGRPKCPWRSHATAARSQEKPPGWPAPPQTHSRQPADSCSADSQSKHTEILHPKNLLNEWYQKKPQQQQTHTKWLTIMLSFMQY